MYNDATIPRGTRVSIVNDTVLKPASLRYLPSNGSSIRNSYDDDFGIGESTSSKLYGRKKSLANKIDPKITYKIWKNMISAYIDFERRNFKKK